MIYATQPSTATRLSGGSFKKGPNFDFARARVRCDDHPARRDLAVKEFEAEGHCAVSEQALPRAEDDRESLEPKFINEVVLQQRLNQVAASVNLELRTTFGLELLDLGDDITVDENRRFPIDIDRTVRDNVFRGLIDPLGNRVVSGSFGPIPSKDVVSSPAEEKVERVPHLLDHDASAEVVEVADGPSAVFEAVRGVFLRRARSLHDSVECDEGQNNESSHSSVL